MKNMKGYLLPESVSEIQQLVVQARKEKKTLRVIGAGHSFPESQYPHGKQDTDVVLLMLSYLFKVQINVEQKLVTVEAGCHLGYDPNDPTQLSTLQNSLFFQLDQAGLAVPDMGGITHQTVGGFLSTGSSGGSTQYGFGECLRSITFIPADSDSPQPVTLQYSDDADNPFFAAGIAMGLFGIIVSATFSLVERFNITGSEVTSTIADSEVDLFGSGGLKPSLQQFLETTSYSRIMWWPQPRGNRLVVWKARQLKANEPFLRNPYQEFGNDPADILQILAGILYKIIGRWPEALSIFNLPSNDYNFIKNWVESNFYSGILPLILDKFQSFGTKQFQDFWYTGLPMDNEVSDRYFPVVFTE